MSQAAALCRSGSDRVRSSQSHQHALSCSHSLTINICMFTSLMEHRGGSRYFKEGGVLIKSKFSPCSNFSLTPTREEDIEDATIIALSNTKHEVSVVLF